MSESRAKGSIFVPLDFNHPNRIVDWGVGVTEGVELGSKAQSVSDLFYLLCMGL
jgi:hypothetical protein